jgi:hypothetical protein
MAYSCMKGNFAAVLRRARVLRLLCLLLPVRRLVLCLHLLRRPLLFGLVRLPSCCAFVARFCPLRQFILLCRFCFCRWFCCCFRRCRRYCWFCYVARSWPVLSAAPVHPAASSGRSGPLGGSGSSHAAGAVSASVDAVVFARSSGTSRRSCCAGAAVA